MFEIIPPFTRIKDSRFVFFPEIGELPTYIEVVEKNISGLAITTVAKAAMEKIVDSSKDFIFMLGGVKWRVLRIDKKLGWLHSIAGTVHRVYEQNIGVYFEVSKVSGWIRKPRDVFQRNVERAYFCNYGSPLPFQDPFTELASLAYQKYEPTITHKDGERLDCSAMRIVMTREGLDLVEREEALQDEAAVNYWKACMVEKYGEKKVEEVCFRYRIDLDELVELTPELVYRFNIGTLLHDRQDLDGIDFTDPLAIENAMKALELDPLSFERALTGRPVFLIKGYCTVIEKECPSWVQDQEIAQVYELLKHNDSFPYFLEKCAHVLSKRFLVREDIESDYKAGLLIPAPRVEGELREWYEVSLLVSNPRGLQTYVLEPLWKGSKLPTLFLDRSTSSDSHSIRGFESVLNDLNSLSAPGNEGRALSERYLDPKINACTVPLWVSYAVASEGCSEEEEVELLTKANRAYAKELKNPLKRKGLRELIRGGYDSLINDLFRTLQSGAWLLKSTFTLPVYPELLKFLSSRSQIEYNEKALSRRLLQELQLSAVQIEDPQVLKAIERLQAEIQLHILDDQMELFLEDTLLDKLKRFEKSRCSKQWRDALLEEARDLNEHPDQKNGSSICFVGHSLGAGSAQVSYVHSFAKRGRLPLPGYSVEGWFYDDPAINHEDNEFFKKWMLKHAALIKKSRVSFTLNRRQEKGDVVPLGGEAHLGATSNEEEARRFEDVVSIDFRLRERKSTAKDPLIAFSRCAHETQFEGGMLGRDYGEEHFDSFAQGQFDLRQGDFVQKWGLTGLHGWVEGEWVRTSRHLGVLVYMLSGAERECSIDPYLDKNGVFVVDQGGVRSVR